jgi:hypothetical protein
MKALQETGRAVDFFDGLQIGLEAWRWPADEGLAPGAERQQP